MRPASRSEPLSLVETGPSPGASAAAMAAAAALALGARAGPAGAASVAEACAVLPAAVLADPKPSHVKREIEERWDSFEAALEDHDLHSALSIFAPTTVLLLPPGARARVLTTFEEKAALLGKLLHHKHNVTLSVLIEDITLAKVHKWSNDKYAAITVSSFNVTGHVLPLPSSMRGADNAAYVPKRESNELLDAGKLVQNWQKFPICTGDGNLCNDSNDRRKRWAFTWAIWNSDFPPTLPPSPPPEPAPGPEDGPLYHRRHRGDIDEDDLEARAWAA
eukprot:SM000078S22048  [mRNA]  locus=s78:153125:154596:- [translate_table: standard]